jgi:broad specificity phosphatase PhoE
MTTFYLIRHAVKADDTSTDPNISLLGREQAQATASYLTSRSIMRVYTSPLRRASETAAIIAAVLHVPLLEDVRLRERMNWGDSEGQSFDEFIALWQRCDADRDFAPPNGLSSRQAGERMADFLRAAQQKFPHEELAAVTHGGTLSDFLRNEFSHEELTQVNPLWATLQGNIFPNGSVTIVQADGAQFALQVLAWSPFGSTDFSVECSRGTPVGRTSRA